MALPSTNAKVVHVLHELARLTELDERDRRAFRVRAYLKAGEAVGQLARDIADLDAAELNAVPGLGTSIAARIREFLDTGTIQRLDELRAKYPPSVVALLDVPGLGARSVRQLVDDLGIDGIPSLVAAIDDGRLTAVDGFGDRTVAKLRAAIEDLGLNVEDRPIALADALPLARRIAAAFEAAGVRHAIVAGSARRMVEHVDGITIVLAGDQVDDMAVLANAVVEVDEATTGDGGHHLARVEGVPIELRRVDERYLGAQMVMATGSLEHVAAVQQRATTLGWHLDESGHDWSPTRIGLDITAGADERFATEAEFYDALGMTWIPPEVRCGGQEIELAANGRLPRLISVDDVRGDLHVHTDLSGDGRDGLEVMVAAAVDRDLEYLAITDHAENLAINGADRQAMLRQRRQLRTVEDQRGDVRLLHGAELNIGADGSLDYDDAFLDGFDWLVASVHSAFDQPVAEQTARLIAAIEHPSVTAIGHLTGRMIGSRRGINFDVEAVLEAFARTGTALEVNASLRRLEPPVDILAEAARRGVALVISTDAHAAQDLHRSEFGVAHARRAWIEPHQVTNTSGVAEFTSWLDDLRS